MAKKKTYFPADFPFNQPIDNPFNPFAQKQPAEHQNSWSIHVHLKIVQTHPHVNRKTREVHSDRIVPILLQVLMDANGLCQKTKGSNGLLMYAGASYDST